MKKIFPGRTNNQIIIWKCSSSPLKISLPRWLFSTKGIYSCTFCYWVCMFLKKKCSKLETICINKSSIICGTGLLSKIVYSTLCGYFNALDRWEPSWNEFVLVWYQIWILLKHGSIFRTPKIPKREAHAQAGIAW